MSESDEVPTKRSNSANQWPVLADAAKELDDIMRSVSASNKSLAAVARRLGGLMHREDTFESRARAAESAAREARALRDAFLIWEHGDPGEGVRHGVAAKLYDLRERAREMLQ